MTTKRILELFCGTKSVGKIFEAAGYEVVSLDYNKKFNATYTEDILTWDYKQFPTGYFNVIWASPDCVTWSFASSGKYRTKSNIWGLNNEHQDKTTLGNNMILRVIEILKYFQPNYWFIENPKALLQHFPPLQQFIEDMGANMNFVYYANYNNWGFPKPTNIWSNLPLWINEVSPVMPTDTYRLIHGSKKRYYTAFDNGSAQERSKIPPDLINRLRLLIPNEGN